jgi:hypothetical protein
MYVNVVSSRYCCLLNYLTAIDVLDMHADSKGKHFIGELAVQDSTVNPPFLLRSGLPDRLAVRSSKEGLDIHYGVCDRSWR